MSEGSQPKTGCRANRYSTMKPELLERLELVSRDLAAELLAPEGDSIAFRQGVRRNMKRGCLETVGHCNVPDQRMRKETEAISLSSQR
jgi:hypothetical protein